jgi:hypothetical protein
VCIEHTLVTGKSRHEQVLYSPSRAVVAAGVWIHARIVTRVFDELSSIALA